MGRPGGIGGVIHGMPLGPEKPQDRMGKLGRVFDKQQAHVPLLRAAARQCEGNDPCKVAASLGA